MASKAKLREAPVTTMHDTTTEPTGGPRCPFCDAPWSQAMLAAYDRAATNECSCCSGPHMPGAQVAEPATAEPEDIRCDTCDRAIYRVVAVPPVDGHRHQ